MRALDGPWDIVLSDLKQSQKTNIAILLTSGIYIQLETESI